MKQQLGLSSQQVQELLQQGKSNRQPNTSTRRLRDIFGSNILTFFNLMNLILVILILLVGSYKNGLFFFVALINTAIGIFQEIRTKHILDKLKIINTSKCRTIRDGKITEISVEKLVLGDVVLLSSGEQVPADAEVVSGSAELDESLLTGESDTQYKQSGDQLLSGSFVTSGSITCRLIHVGSDNYSYKLTMEAKYFKHSRGKLHKSLSKILRIVSVIILPLGILLIGKEYFITGSNITESVVHGVAAMVGMIPEGLILLTSISLAIGIINLSKYRALVQQLHCIETLARVDVLCLDKTGTITEGRLEVQEIIPWNSAEVSSSLEAFSSLTNDTNPTAKAIKNYFKPRNSYIAEQIIDFSSERKYSGIVINGKTILVGAAERLFQNNILHKDFLKKCSEYSSEGLRVVAVGESNSVPTDKAIPSGITPVGIILMSDVVRSNAKETLDFFRAQGVRLIIISGDNPKTAAAIAKKAGFNDIFPCDASSLRSANEIKQALQQFNIFGRVSPSQKKEMVTILKELGHTVAMTGDGVNDVTALKAADCSIAMAAGSTAAKNTANLVLLNSDFTTLPHILNEGRRVNNNIMAAASMFLIKTVFSIILSLFSVFIGDGYPFQPIHMTLIACFATGIPTFILQSEPNYRKVSGNILVRAITKALPSAFAVAICVVALVTADIFLHFPEGVLDTMCTFITGIIYTSALYRIYKPLSKLRFAVVAACQTLFIAALVFGYKMFELVIPPFHLIIASLLFAIISFLITYLFSKLKYKFIHRIFAD